MPFSIQEFPSGLLPFFGIKSFGATPPELAELVAGTVDLTEMYLLERLSIKREINQPMTLGDQACTITVPEGEIWRVLGIGSALTPSATGTIVSVSHFLQRPPISGNEYIPLGPSMPPRATIAGEVRVDHAVLFPVPFYVSAGMIFQGAITADTGGATSLIYTLRVLYHRLLRN